MADKAEIPRISLIGKVLLFAKNWPMLFFPLAFAVIIAQGAIFVYLIFFLEYISNRDVLEFNFMLLAILSPAYILIAVTVFTVAKIWIDFSFGVLRMVFSFPRKEQKFLNYLLRWVGVDENVERQIENSRSPTH